MARLANALVTLRAQVDAAHPGRAKFNDGWIGDTAHQARKSDHNPNGAGVVQAIDLSHDPEHGFDSYAFADMLRQKRDPRIKYLISNSRIMSSSVNAWEWRPYSGADAHAHHVHVSASDDPARYDDARPWDIEATAVVPPPPLHTHDEPPAAPPMPAQDHIVAIANASPIMRYPWRGRGAAPAGYTRGMALTFAQAYRRLKAGDPAVLEMAKANTHNDEHDALAWYNSNFAAVGMSNDHPGADTLRHLFVLMLGHGMRESSGQHCCGRDHSAANVASDTAEAGLFQTSYNAHTCHPAFDPLMDAFKAGRLDGFLLTFQTGVTCSAADWSNYGSGRGADFQDLCKKQPAFSVESAAIVLRNLRRHYGPINRKEVELRPEADAMFKAVQAHVDAEVTA